MNLPSLHAVSGLVVQHDLVKRQRLVHLACCGYSKQVLVSDEVWYTAEGIDAIKRHFLAGVHRKIHEARRLDDLDAALEDP